MSSNRSLGASVIITRRPIRHGILTLFISAENLSRNRVKDFLCTDFSFRVVSSAGARIADFVECWNHGFFGHLTAKSPGRLLHYGNRIAAKETPLRNKKFHWGYNTTERESPVRIHHFGKRISSENISLRKRKR